MKKVINNDTFWAFIFIFPSLLGILIFNFIPTLSSFYISFTKWNLLGNPQFVGFKNYISLFSDPLFYKVLYQTFIFVFCTVFIEVILSIFIAVLLNSLIIGKTFFRTIYFLPVITSMIAGSILWNWIFDPAYGFLNYFLSFIGIEKISWLADENWALFSIILVSIWKNIGYSTVLIVAGLQTIPNECIEASKIDGASKYQTFFKIVLPLLSPTIFMVTIVSFINSFQTFDSVYILTSGGPKNSTNIMVYWLYKNAFEYYNMGKASAIAYVLFFIILLFTLIQWNIRKKWVFYEK
ncbi:MAG: sugar ABC transporter permease [Candidatus Sericytochromatia bacterium]|nr:MAG: sugar ABC transporter permease [Candidatus Sericytochromatia bacterium]